MTRDTADKNYIREEIVNDFKVTRPLQMNGLVLQTSLAPAASIFLKLVSASLEQTVHPVQVRECVQG